MTYIQAWMQAFRINTLVASISPVLIASCLACKYGSFSWFLFLLTLLFALLVQIGTNLSNDYFDCIKGADTSERLGPLRVCQAQLLPMHEVRFAFFFLFACAFLIACWMSLKIGGWLFLLGALSITLGILYTAGPCPLGYMGLGELLVMVFFGPVASGISYFIQTEVVALEAFGLGCSTGLLSCALLVVNNLRDQMQDAKCGKNTLVVRLGNRFGKMEYSVCMLLPCFIPLYFYPSFLLFAAPLFLIALSLVRKAFQEPLLYHPLLMQTGYFLWAYTLLINYWIVIQ